MSNYYCTVTFLLPPVLWFSFQEVQSPPAIRWEADFLSSSKYKLVHIRRVSPLSFANLYLTVENKVVL